MTIIDYLAIMFAVVVVWVHASGVMARASDMRRQASADWSAAEEMYLETAARSARLSAALAKFREGIALAEYGAEAEAAEALEEANDLLDQGVNHV